MRPNVAHDPPEPRSRKHSIADQAATSTDRPNAAPMTFFLARGSSVFDAEEEQVPRGQGQGSPVRSLKETIEEASQPPAPIISRGHESSGRNSSRRRSTIKPTTPQKSRRESSIHSTGPSLLPDEVSPTPPFVPSREISLPSSPKSVSSPSLNRSDEDSASDENKSQAIVSSEDEDGEPSSPAIQDSAPQLIMPSIRMPSRRPFTERGKCLGRLKILVGGCQGAGKTSLIKSIVQLCEDIVHVDPLSPRSSMSDSLSRIDKEKILGCTEIYASTKPYPSWWSDVEESRILRRRKSMGDSVLERNVCFVEASASSKSESTIRYMEQQLQKAMASSSLASNDLSGLLSGRGGSQVDVILYLISKDALQADCERLQDLSEIANVVPLIAKADTISAEDIAVLKGSHSSVTSSLPKLPVLDSVSQIKDTPTAASPYTISSANGPDTETMDASLLMSPEYVQPLLPSELPLLISQIFDPEVVAYLRHTAAKKLINWHATHPLLQRTPSPSVSGMSAHNSTLASPLPSSLSNSGVLVPFGSDLSLTTSNSYALALVADHSQREERLAQVRLSKWASDLQISLQRERERYEKLARGDRAFWLIERMGEEIRDGQVVPLGPRDESPHSQMQKQALVRNHQIGKAILDGGDYGFEGESAMSTATSRYTMHDPLGLLRWQDAMRTRGWIALQVVGSFGVLGGLAFWLAKTWGGVPSSVQGWFGGSE